MLHDDATVIHAVKQVAVVWVRVSFDCKHITVLLSWFVPRGR